MIGSGHDRPCCTALAAHCSRSPLLSDRVSSTRNVGGVFPILYSRPHFLHHASIMEIRIGARLSSSQVESHSRTVRFTRYLAQFVQEPGPASIESAGGLSSCLATYFMDTRSYASIVHFFLSSITVVGMLIILSGNPSPQWT